jgi:hypothetical protein
MLVLIGPTVAAAVTQVLETTSALPITQRAKLIVSASPIRDGAILRLAGENSEEVAREVRRTLSFVAEFLGDDPWARKW